MQPLSVYFSFQLLELSPHRRVWMRLAGLVLLPAAALLWLLPYRLACFNLKAFGHLCLEPFLLSIDERVRARVFALGGGQVANPALYAFLKTRYPVIENRWCVGLLATLYSWRFLQVDIGAYIYSHRGELPTYSAVLQRYGSTEIAAAYRQQFRRFVDQYRPSPALASFLETHPNGYAVVHWRVDGSKAIHNIRNSQGRDLLDAIRAVTAAGYGVCIGGDGYEQDPSYAEIAAMQGVCFPPRDPEDAGFADLWLLAHATFGVYGDSGISIVAAVLGQPAVIHNQVARGLPALDQSWISCFKSLRWQATGEPVADGDLRRLNLLHKPDGLVCAAHGIVAVDCSAAEISEAVLTLLRRLPAVERR